MVSFQTKNSTVWDKKISLLTNLAIAFQRIYNVPIKQSGNYLIDINNIAEKLNLQITVYAINQDIDS